MEAARHHHSAICIELCAMITLDGNSRQVHAMVANLHRFTAGLEPLPWRLQQLETYGFRKCHFGFGGEALKSKKQLWRKKVRTTTSLVVSLHLSSPKNEKAAFFGLQRLEPSTHKLMASHAARRCATKPRKRLRIRLRTSCVCET